MNWKAEMIVERGVRGKSGEDILVQTLSESASRLDQDQYSLSVVLKPDGVRKGLMDLLNGLR